MGDESSISYCFALRRSGNGARARARTLSRELFIARSGREVYPSINIRKIDGIGHFEDRGEINGGKSVLYIRALAAQRERGLRVVYWLEDTCNLSRDEVILNLCWMYTQERAAVVWNGKVLFMAGCS